MAEPSDTPTVAGMQTAVVSSIVSSLITALVILSILFAVFGIYSVMKARSNNHSTANEDIVYEAVDEIVHDGIAMSMTNCDAYQQADVAVNMERNEAYGIGTVKDGAEDS